MQFEGWFTSNNSIYWYLLIYAFIMGYVIIDWLRKRGRIKVRIKTPFKEKEIWKKPESDGKTIVMVKSHGKKPGWSFTFTNASLVPKRGRVRSYFAIDVFPDADKAIDYNYTVPEIDQPKWDKKTSTKFIEAKTMEKLGEAEKLPAPGLLWVLVILGIIGVALEILNMRGIKIV